MLETQSEESAYGVFQDSERHTCIRVALDKTGVTYIPWDNVGLAVHKLSHKEFEQRYVIELTDYPVKKATASFLGATWVEMTEEVRKYLTYIQSGKFKEVNQLINFENKEHVMNEKAKAAAPKKAEVKKAPALKKVDAAKPEKVAPPAKAEPKKVAAPAKEAAKAAPAAKAEPQKVAAPAAKAEPAKPRGKASPYTGKKITVLAKENPKRVGSGAHKIFALYKTGMTFEAFVTAGGNVAAVDYDVKHKFISVA